MSDVFISQEKEVQLAERMSRLGIRERELVEKFILGSGKGGQKINKTANCVQLYYPPLDIRVRCQRERRRSLNRFLALRELVDQIEMKVSPETSGRLQEMQRVRKRKAQRQRRAVSKYGLTTPTEPAPPS